MNQPFSLRAPLAENTAAHPQDVLAVKTFLQRLGHYKAPDWGITPFPDAALFAAVRAFQQAQGLHADGVMKQGGKTEATIRSTAQRLQAMGRNGDTLLAHITPAEAQLLDAVTDGGSINPRTGLMEFWGRMGGSNYSRAQREESDHRAASAEREKNNTQQSGDWSSERNRSLGYNDFNPGGLHGDKNLNGTKKTGAELDRHLRTVQAQLEKESADAAAKIQALAVKQAADARRLREDEAKAAKDLARSFNVAQQKAQQDTPQDAGLLTESTPTARSFAAPATPNEATQNDAPLGSNGPTTRRAASQPTGRPTAPDSAFATASNKTLPGVDPRWGPSATPAQQARNIENTKKNEEKRQQQAAKAQQTASAARSTQNKGALQSALERFNLSPVASTTPTALTTRAPGRDLRERVLASRANATPQRTPARTPDQKAADVGEQPMTGSVGPHGKNVPADVARVQRALVQNGTMHPATATGYIGTATLDAIRAYQKKYGLKIDGLITPGGPTEAALTQDQKAANVGEQPMSSKRVHAPRSRTYTAQELAARSTVTTDEKRNVALHAIQNAEITVRQSEQKRNIAQDRLAAEIAKANRLEKQLDEAAQKGLATTGAETVTGFVSGGLGGAARGFGTAGVMSGLDTLDTYNTYQEQMDIVAKASSHRDRMEEFLAADREALKALREAYAHSKESF